MCQAPKTSLNKFKITETISSIFSNHNGKNQQINNRKKTEKFINTEKLNKHTPEQPMDQSNQREMRKYLETNKNQNLRAKQKQF